VPGDVSLVSLDERADVGYWRVRAERAEARSEEAEDLARCLGCRVGELSEQVAVLSRMLFGRSSEKNQDRDHGDEGR
jgi:transposase